MTHLLSEIGRDESLMVASELQLPRRLADALLDSQSQRSDDDFDHFWIDVGGEG